MSKILERIASMQIVQYMSINRLFDPFQSAFHKFYSTETALNLVINDLLLTLDNQNCIQLVLIDIMRFWHYWSQYNILITILSRLSNIGIAGVPLDWFKSCLTHCTSSIQIHVFVNTVMHNSFSSPTLIKNDVPQFLHLELSNKKLY